MEISTKALTTPFIQFSGFQMLDRQKYQTISRHSYKHKEFELQNEKELINSLNSHITRPSTEQRNCHRFKSMPCHEYFPVAMERIGQIIDNPKFCKNLQLRALDHEAKRNSIHDFQSAEHKNESVFDTENRINKYLSSSQIKIDYDGIKKLPVFMALMFETRKRILSKIKKCKSHAGIKIEDVKMEKISAGEELINKINAMHNKASKNRIKKSKIYCLNSKYRKYLIAKKGKLPDYMRDKYNE